MLDVATILTDRMDVKRPTTKAGVDGSIQTMQLLHANVPCKLQSTSTRAITSRMGLVDIGSFTVFANIEHEQEAQGTEAARVVVLDVKPHDLLKINERVFEVVTALEPINAWSITCDERPFANWDVK
jgi:hypothetical protein